MKIAKIKYFIILFITIIVLFLIIFFSTIKCQNEKALKSNPVNLDSADNNKNMITDRTSDINKITGNKKTIVIDKIKDDNSIKQANNKLTDVDTATITDGNSSSDLQKDIPISNDNISLDTLSSYNQDKDTGKLKDDTSTLNEPVINDTKINDITKKQLNKTNPTDNNILSRNDDKSEKKPQNLISNGSFDKTLFYWIKNNSKNIFAIIKKEEDGNNYFSIDSLNNTKETNYCCQTIPYDFSNSGSMKLSLTLKIKTESVTGKGLALAIRFDDTGKIISKAEDFFSTSGKISITGNFDWKEYEVKWPRKIKENMKSVTVYLYILPFTTGNFYFDDIRLELY
jgi:hypothetical protein